LAAIMVLGYLGVHQTIALLHSPRAGVTPSVRFVTSRYQPDDLYLVPTDMELFRMAAKVPILADFQSNPYKDADVVEWYKRVEIANTFYAASGKQACEILRNLSNKYGITDVVFKSGASIPDCGFVYKEYQGADLSIYDLNVDEAHASLGGK